MRTPFFNIVLAGVENISMYVDDFTFEDCMNEDSMLEIYAYPKEGRGESLLDEAVKLDTGNAVEFHFGFMAGDRSLVRKAVVKDIEARYNSSGVRVLVRALTKGVDLKRSTSSKIWKNKTSAEIVREIASKHGLTSEVEDTQHKWPSIPQGNMSDMDFIAYLAKRETDGNFVAYVKDNTLTLVKRKTDAESSVTFTWGDPNGTVISFEPKQRESTSSKGSSSTSVNTYELDKQKISVNKADNASEKGETTLGDVKIRYNGVDGVKLSEFIDKKLVRPESGALSSNIANSEKKKGQLGLLEASLRIEGNPLIVPNTVITINGVADRYIGNWLVTKARHTINGSGFITTLELVKNGRKRGGDKAKKKNTTVGPEKAKDKVKLIKYDGATGKRVN